MLRLETSGARLEADDLATLLGHPRVLGLAEVMSYPGVIAGSRVAQAVPQRHLRVAFGAFLLVFGLWFAAHQLG